MQWYYLIPVVYLLVVLGIGFALMRKQETRSDFYVASNKMDGAVLFATVMSTVIGANTYMGFSGMVYSSGLSVMWLLSCAGFSYFVLYFISGKIRMIAAKYEVFTLPDLMELRYSKPVAILTTIFSMIGLIGGTGGGILGIGIILHSLLGIPTTVAIIITSVVTIIYTTMGGLWGVALTDWVQSLIMILGLVLCLIFGISAITPSQSFFGGAFEIGKVLQANMDPGLLNPLNGVTVMMLIAWAITFMPLNTISQTQIQRVYAAKDVKTIRVISMLMVIFTMVLMTFGLAFVGLLGRDALPNLKNPETVFPMMSMQVLNPAIGMLVVTGILGACMSTVDSNLLGSAMHVTRDIYERYMNYKKLPIDEKGILSLSRLTIVIIGIISTLTALYTPSIMNLLLVTMKIFAGATFAPVIIGLFWKRANAHGALLGEILGGGGVLIQKISPIVKMDPVIFGIILATLGTVIGSLVTREDVEKGKMFNFAMNFTSKDALTVISTALIFIIFAIAVTNITAWPYIIIATVSLLSLSIVFLIYGFVAPRVKAQNPKIEAENIGDK